MGSDVHRLLAAPRSRPGIKERKHTRVHLEPLAQALLASEDTSTRSYVVGRHLAAGAAKKATGNLCNVINENKCGVNGLVETDGSNQSQSSSLALSPVETRKPRLHARAPGGVAPRAAEQQPSGPCRKSCCRAGAQLPSGPRYSAKPGCLV